MKLLNKKQAMEHLTIDKYEVTSHKFDKMKTKGIIPPADKLKGRIQSWNPASLTKARNHITDLIIKKELAEERKAKQKDMSNYEKKKNRDQLFDDLSGVFNSYLFNHVTAIKGSV